MERRRAKPAHVGRVARQHVREWLPSCYLSETGGSSGLIIFIYFSFLFWLYNILTGGYLSAMQPLQGKVTRSKKGARGSDGSPGE